MSFVGRGHRPRAGELDVHRIRSHFDFVGAGRVVTNNAASTQPPRELVDLYRSLVPWYDNVHRGQSTASGRTTALFESSYDTVAGWLNAPSRRNIATFRNTTEAHNAVMYSLLTEFRDGDNVVTTMLEHNSNFVPWYGLCHEILPRFGRRVECRVARFDGPGGLLDLDHLASLVDDRTKLICCTAASNFFGSKPDQVALRAIADGSGYHQPSGERRSLLLLAVPSSSPAARWTSGRWVWTTCRSPSIRCSPRSGSACCTPRSICCTTHCRSSTAAT
jgi:cysteine desulfurase / selenocysteine lyase